MKTAHFVIGQRQAGQTLLDAISAHLGVSRRRAKQVVDARMVFVNRRRTWMARHALQRGDTIDITGVPNERGNPTPAKILWQDAGLLVADKPPGCLANGTDSLESRLRETTGNTALTAAHRLDRDTSGCLIFATNPDTLDMAQKLFYERKIGKAYQAVVHGFVTKRTFRVRRPLDGQRATSDILVLDSGKIASHLRVHIETGRTHQIRRHLAALHHPVLGDRHYGTGRSLSDTDIMIPRQMLHAAEVSFLHPATGKRIVVKSRLPRDFRRILKSLNLT